MLGKRPIYTNVHNIDGTLVVAKDIQEAIRLYKEVYPNETIKKVEMVKGDWDDHFGLALCGVEEDFDPLNVMSQMDK